MFKHFASLIGKRIHSNQGRLFLAAGTAILAAVAFTLASVAANDPILPPSNRAQASRPANTPAPANNPYTRYSGFCRTHASFVSPLREPMGDPMPQTLDGLWWKHDPNVTGWIALSNVSDTDKQVSVQLVGPGNDLQPERTIPLPAHSTQMFYLEDFAANPSTLAKQ